MAVPATDWRARIADLGDVLIKVDGKAQPWILPAGGDETISVDFTAQLGSGETIASQVTRLLMWRSVTETADTDVTASLPAGPTVSGNSIVQRVNATALTRGRYYGLEFNYGPTGNKRGGTLPIHIPE